MMIETEQVIADAIEAGFDLNGEGILFMDGLPVILLTDNFIAFAAIRDKRKDAEIADLTIKYTEAINVDFPLLAKLIASNDAKDEEIADLKRVLSNKAKKWVMQGNDIAMLKEALKLLVDMCVTEIGVDYSDEIHRRYLIGKKALAQWEQAGEMIEEPINTHVQSALASPNQEPKWYALNLKNPTDNEYVYFFKTLEDAEKWQNEYKLDGIEATIELLYSEQTVKEGKK
jgi:hypothetical protein